MKKVLVFVTSLDGKITRWGESHVKKWSSEEDKHYYKKILDDSPLTIMGSNTFDVEQQGPSPTHHVIVMTRTPSEYKDRGRSPYLNFFFKSKINR